MKIEKLLKLSQELLSDEEGKKADRKKYLVEIQLKLKKKAKKLKEKLSLETDNKLKKKIENDLVVITAQRKKIIKTLEEMK